MILLAATLWFAQPAPLEMPRASAYLVKDAEGALWLEDRYDEADLWTARTVLSRWSDREGRRFTVAKLETIAPTVEGPTLTRERFVADEMPLPDKREDLREQAIALLAPFDLPEEPSAPRRDVHGFKEVRYYQGTNETAVVCAFRPEDTKACYLAVWELAPGDSIDSAVDVFETDFLAKWKDRLREGVRSELDPPPAPPRRARRRPHLAERVLMLAAARHSVTN